MDKCKKYKQIQDLKAGDNYNYTTNTIQQTQNKLKHKTLLHTKTFKTKNIKEKLNKI